MKYVFVIVIMLSCISVHAQHLPTITPIKILDRTFVDTTAEHGKILTLKFDFFLIEGYKNNQKTLAYINYFAQKNRDKELEKYFEYHMMFYKKSAKTNIENINESIKTGSDYVDNEDDFVLDYVWYNGRNFERHVLDSGKEVHQPKGGYKKMSIIPLSMLNSIDTIKDQGAARVTRSDYFLVKGYQDNGANSGYINQFVKKRGNFDVKKYEDYHIIFYMETIETNLKTITQYVKTKDKYYQNNSDMIYQFDWYDGKFLGRSKYHNGRIEPKGNISFKNIPIPTDTIKKQ